MNDIKEISGSSGTEENRKHYSGLSWVNILLLTVNVCFLVAFVWYFVTSDTKLDSRMKSNSNEFLKDELNLTQDQYDQLNLLDKDNFEKTQVVLKLLCEQRNELLAEISKEEPSRERLNEITKETGYLHRGLNHQSVQHLLNIKEICTPEQKERMNEIFRELIGVDNQCKYCSEKCAKSKK